MNAYLETAIRKHFETNSELMVDVVDGKGGHVVETFTNEYNAITDLDNRDEDIFYPFVINDINDLNF